MTKQQITSTRRMGPVGSENWHAMLDSAQDVLLEEGHASLSSRRIAERLGVKQRLIYYYFRTMDDLIIDLFRRSNEREIERLNKAARSSRPLHEIWNVCIDTVDARLVSEFTALANRSEGLKKEVIFFIEESRAIQVRALEQAAAKLSDPSGLSAVSLAFIATSIALSLNREETLAIKTGHAETRAMIEKLIDRYEPGD